MQCVCRDMFHYLGVVIPLLFVICKVCGHMRFTEVPRDIVPSISLSSVFYGFVDIFCVSPNDC